MGCHSQDQGLYASEDGGKTWRLVSDVASDAPTWPNAPDGHAGWLDFVVDPRDPTQLWRWDGNGVFHSTDSATTWERAEEIETPTTVGAHDVHVDHKPGRPPRVLVAPYYLPHHDVSNYLVLVSKEGGKTWSQIVAPGRVEELTGVGNSNDIVAYIAGDPSSIQRYQAGKKKWRNISPQFYDPLPKFSDFSRDLARRPSLWA